MPSHVRTEGERGRVEKPGEYQQGAVAHDEREVFEAAADHRTEQIRGECARGVLGRVEARCEDDVRGEHRPEGDGDRDDHPDDHRQRQQPRRRHEPRDGQGSRQERERERSRGP